MRIDTQFGTKTNPSPASADAGSPRGSDSRCADGAACDGKRDQISHPPRHTRTLTQ